MKPSLQHFPCKTRNTRWEKKEEGSSERRKSQIKRKGRRWEGKTFPFDNFLLTLTAVELVILVEVSYVSSAGVITFCVYTC